MHRPRHQLKDMLILFAFDAILAEFICMLWVIIKHEYKSLSHTPRFRWDCMILQYAVIAGLIQCALHLMQISDFATDNPTNTHHNRAFCILYSYVRYKWLQLLHQNFADMKSPICPKDFKLWIVSLNDFIPMLFSTAFCTLVHCSLLTSFCFLNSSSLTAILTYTPASHRLLRIMDVDTCFNDVGSVVKWCLEQSVVFYESWGR